MNTFYVSFQIKRTTKEELRGGTPKENAEIIKGIFKGDIKGAKKDILLLNSGAALYVGKRASSIKEGIDLAREIIESGRALTKLEQLIEITNK